MKILLILYNILLIALLPLILPIGYLVALKRKEEKWYFERFGFIVFDKKPDKTIWIHCASVGEVLSVKSLIEKIKKEMPGYNIAVSTVTATGKDVALKNLNADFIFLLPLENYFAIKYLTSFLNTKYFLIIDTELWPNLIFAAHKNARLILVNGRLSERSYPKYKLFKPIFKRLLSNFEHIFAKSKIDAERLADILDSQNNISDIGNIKVINIESSDNNFEFNGKIFLAASTHQGEETFIKSVFEKVKDNFDHLIIAPRHLNRVKEVFEIFSEPFDTSLLSEDKKTKVIIVDSFGILKNLYSCAQKVFVGGSVVNVGGHNIYEALIFKKVVAVGKHMQNFTEIFELAKKYNIVFTVENENDMLEYLKADKFTNADFEGFIAETKAIAEKPIIEIVNFLKNEDTDFNTNQNI
ncbi:3-deoxy-D-manno-octulosonic acid transferase [Deferribacteraceae bacterium V6Fe1]|nr:3-deoxy-D-manno-octulosonic acid transferase [Deferribacteraceae bacterium V6Fe1]